MAKYLMRITKTLHHIESAWEQWLADNDYVWVETRADYLGDRWRTCDRDIVDSARER